MAMTQMLNFNSIPTGLLVGGGIALGWIRGIWRGIWDHSFGYIIRKLHIAVSIEESETEEAYKWLNLWAEKRIREKKITDLRLYTVQSEKECRAYEAVPNYGTYYLRYRQRYLLVFSSEKEKTDGSPQSDQMGRIRPRRSVRIAVWGTLDRNIIHELLDEAWREFYSGFKKKLFVYYNQNAWWESRELSPRALDTVYLPDSVVDSVLKSTEMFLGSRETYNRLGIPWRFGILLYGPPGTGKSSMVRALATKYALPIYYLNVGSVERPGDLQRLIESVPNRSILLIEDVDSIPAARHRKEESTETGCETVKKGEDKGVIAADLLNAIDGVIATEGRILIFTTNHRERLDPALIRRGRVDAEFHITTAQDEELKKFYENAARAFDLPAFETFRQRLPRQTTIADAQALLFEYPIRPIEVATNNQAFQLEPVYVPRGDYGAEISA
jgi:hypothetical protein